MRKLLTSLCAIGVIAISPLSAHALEDGDTVKIIVPYSPGGGYDTQARLVAPYLQARLNDGAYDDITIVVENMRGGGGAIATAHVYNADPDGTTLLILDAESSLYQEMLADAPFHVAEFEYLAQQSSDSLVFQTRSDLEFDSFEEALARSHSQPLLNAGSPGGGYGWVFPQLLVKLLEESGVDLRIENLPISGTSDVIASMRRGEVEMNIGSHTGFRKAHDEGVMDYLAAFNDPGETVMCNDGSGGQEPCPDASEVMGMTEENYEKLQPAARFRRIYVAPPGTDAETVENLRQVFAAVLQDPEFVKKAEAAQQPVTFLPGGKVTEAFSKEISLAKQYQDYLKSKQ
jgi:tripartite-type tricarboxylate transporter receptor subunit TctC